MQCKSQIICIRYPIILHYDLTPPFSAGTGTGLVPNPSSVTPVAGLASGLPRFPASAGFCLKPFRPLVHLLGGAYRPLGLVGESLGVPFLDPFSNNKGGVSGVTSLEVDGGRFCSGYDQFLVS